MICRSCGSKWETGIRIQNCPFCGAPLPDESRPMNTPEDVLCEMVRQFGPGILHEEQRMLGIFADMAPHLAGPRRLLGYLVECDGPRKLIAIQNRSPEEREQCVSALVSRMQNELYVDANGARSICTSFLSAVLNSDGPHPDRKVPAREQGPAEPDQGQGEEKTARNEGSDIQDPPEASSSHVSEWVQEGKRLLNGTRETPPNREEAFRLFLRAAEQGDAEAQFLVGDCFSRGTGTRKDEKQAIFWLKEAAKNGNVWALLDLGRRFEEGRDVPQDLEKAVSCFRASAEKGNNAACCCLAHAYEFGIGTEKDPVQAYLWYRKSAEQGSARGQFHTGRACEFGIGTEKDPAQAFYWYRKSAVQGNVRGQLQLGRFYEFGIGTDRDSAQAFFWYWKAADQGDAYGQFYLGRACEFGIGTESDPVQALTWYRKSAEQGYAPAQYRLGMACESGFGTRKDPGQAFEWYRRSARQGNVEALYQKGRCHEKGIGCPVQPELAKNCYLTAVEQNCGDALEPLLRLYFSQENLTDDDMLRIRDVVLPRTRGKAAKDLLYRLALRLVDSPACREQAIYWIRAFAGEGERDAIQWLVHALQEGAYIQKDPWEAELWRRRLEGGDAPDQSVFQWLPGNQDG